MIVISDKEILIYKKDKFNLSSQLLKIRCLL